MVGVLSSHAAEQLERFIRVFLVSYAGSFVACVLPVLAAVLFIGRRRIQAQAARAADLEERTDGPYRAYRPVAAVSPSGSRAQNLASAAVAAAQLGKSLDAEESRWAQSVDGSPSQRQDQPFAPASAGVTPPLHDPGSGALNLPMTTPPGLSHNALVMQDLAEMSNDARSTPPLSGNVVRSDASTE
mmetsp:Transcript_113004/g.326536  ORF Transcript_113004/g.326536 Transcript_113004/m.326536 type:complete len:186 (-) Transcript_113004:254-811(-)